VVDSLLCVPIEEYRSSRAQRKEPSMKGYIDQNQKIGRRLIVVASLCMLALSAAPATSALADSGKQPTKPAVTLPLGSMYNVVDQVGARALWAKGYTGEGVTVALIDTGFAPIPELLDSGKVIQAVDLSSESAVPEAMYTDNYGHGTHMAGIIAGETRCGPEARCPTS
jgi:subtilisin family serine protease